MKLSTSTSFAIIATLIGTTFAANNAVVNGNCGADITACRNMINEIPSGTSHLEKNYYYDWQGCYLVFTPSTWGASESTTLNMIKGLLKSALANASGSVQACVAPSGGGSVCIGAKQVQTCCAAAYDASTCKKCAGGALPLTCSGNEDGSGSNCA